MIVEPGSRASSRTAISAVSVDGDTISPRSSTTKQRSASPSKASPRSAPTSRTFACRSTRFAGSIGFASWLGKDPSSSKYRSVVSSGNPSNVTGTVRPPIPLPASTTTFNGRMPARSGTSSFMYAAYSCSISWLLTEPGFPSCDGRPSSRYFSESARSCARPVSWPTGFAPARQSLIPLYFAGLWLAVNIAPGMSSLPAAKYSRSVEPRPAPTTSAPRLVAPSAKAADKATPDSRMSRAVTICFAPVKRAKAAPRARAMSAFSWSGTTPRTSYALTMLERSATRLTLVPRTNGAASDGDLVLLGLAQNRRDVEVRAGLLPRLGLAGVAGDEVDDRAVRQRHRDLGDARASASGAGTEHARGGGHEGHGACSWAPGECVC